MTSVTARFVALATNAVKERDTLIALKGIGARLRKEKGAVAVAPEACAQEDVEVAKLQAEVKRLSAEVTDTQPDTLVDALLKARFLVGTQMSPGSVMSIKADIDRLLAPDPIIELSDRWLRIDDFIRRTYSSDDDIPPEVSEAEAERERLEDVIFKMKPRTPEALARMLDIAWRLDGPAHTMGTEGWADAMESYDYRSLRSLRHAAHAMAGTLDC